MNFCKRNIRKLRFFLLLAALTLVIGVLPSVKARAVNEEFTTDDGFVFRAQGYYNDSVYDLAGYTGNNPKVVIPEYVDNEKYGRRPVMRISRGAFKDNKNIESVSIPASVTSIEKEAFMGCTSLTEAILEGDNHRWALDNIKNSSTYLTIGDRAFADCTKLTDFEIPYGIDVTSGEDIFAGSGLKHIRIVLCGWTQLVPKIFNNCPELEVVDIDCESYEPGKSKRPGLNSMTGLPKLKEINVYGIENNGTLGIDYGSSSSDHIEKEDCPSLEYVNIYYSAEAVGVTAHAFANTEQTSSDPSVVLIEGNKTSGYYYRVKGEGTAEITCEKASYKIRIIVGQNKTSKKNIADAKLTVPVKELIYTGTARVPYLYLLDGKTLLEEDKDYTVAAKDNTEIGTATLTVTGIGDYAGTITDNFSIIPVRTDVKSVKIGKKESTIVLNDNKQADGYQIYYSSKKNKGFKKLYSGTDIKAKVTKLKSGMYIKVRTYKKVGKTTYYSEWSAPVQVK